MLDLSISFTPKRPAQSAIATTSSMAAGAQPDILISLLTAINSFSQTLNSHILKVDTGMAEMHTGISTLFDVVKKREETKREEDAASQSRKRKMEEKREKKK